MYSGTDVKKNIEDLKFDMAGKWALRLVLIIESFGHARVDESGPIILLFDRLFSTGYLFYFCCGYLSTVADTYLLCYSVADNYCCGYLSTLLLLRIRIYFRPVILFRMTIKGAISCRWCTWDLTVTRFFFCVFT